MSFMSGAKVPKPPAPPVTTDPNVQADQLRQRQRALLAKGRQAMLLTSQPTPLGVVGTPGAGVRAAA